MPHQHELQPRENCVIRPLQTSFQGNTSIKQLVKHGRVREARRLLHEMKICDVYSWTALLSGYVNIGEADQALDFFCHMQRENVVPNNVTFISALKACVMTLSLEWGRNLHACIMDAELEFDVFVGSCLVDMYAKCGSIQDAAHVFSRLTVRNVVSWSTLISGYVKEGFGTAALHIFLQMQHEKVAPNEVTLASSLSACALELSLEQGQEMNHYAVCCGFDADHILRNKLIDMYVKCSSIQEARHVFDRSNKLELFAWNTMIEGYVKHEQGMEAVQLFSKMMEKGISPDKVTFLSSLKACTQVQDLGKGEYVYECIRNSSLDIDEVLGSSLIDMFAKCGSIKSAYSVFKILDERDAIAWTIMISAFLQHGDTVEAFKLFEEMRQARVLPDKFTYNIMVSACACMSDLDRGKKLHADIVANEHKLDVTVGSSLVDMYASCGDLEKAQGVFDCLSHKDNIAWNAMIACYAQHGDCKGLQSLIEKMHNSGVILDSVTYVIFLSACSHLGLVDAGYQLMGLIAIDLDSTIISEHCSCLIDLLSRAGHLNEAKELIESIPFQPGPADWMALLGACRLCYNVENAKIGLENLQELEPHGASAYVLFSNTLEPIDD